MHACCGRFIYLPVWGFQRTGEQAMRLNDVFGITAKKLETYVERGADDDFKRCLQGRQHIVLHGSSKQGKTSLRKRYLNDNHAIAVSCQSDWDLPKMYLSILRRAGCQPKLIEERVGAAHGTVRLDLGVPGLGLKLGGKPKQYEKVEYKYEGIDPDDPNDIIERPAGDQVQQVDRR